MFRNLGIASIALLLALALAACHGRRVLVAKGVSPADGTPRHDADEGADGGEVPPSEDPGAEDGVDETPADAPAPSPDELARAAAERRAIEADRARFVVRQRLESARILIEKGSYREAYELLQSALELDPSHREVRAELRDLEALLGKRDSGAADYARRQAEVTKVRIDEQRTKAAKLTHAGQVALASGRYDDAIESFENALFIIQTSPYQIEWGSIEKDASNGLRHARASKTQGEKQARQDAVARSLAEMAAQEEQRLMQEMERLERWMGAAIEAFNRNQFELAAEYARQVLEVQPDNTKAMDLLSCAQRAQNEQMQVDFLRREKQSFREWYDEMQRTRIPQQKILQWPSRKFWERISTARAQSRPSFGEIEVDNEGEALMKKIQGTSVNLAVEGQTFSEVTRSLQIQTGFNLYVDPRASGDLADATVTNLVMTDIPMDSALNMLVSATGVEDAVWHTRGGLIVFTRKEFVKRNLVTQLHSVADLTAGLTDFIPPSIRLVSPDDVSDEEQPLFGSESEEPIFPYGQIDELIELIQGAVSPTFWSENENAKIVAQGEHNIVVRSTPEVQEQVARFLNDLRGFAGIVVTIETRFLEVSENFLVDVGVDFRGLGGQTPGPLVNLDDVTNGLEDAASAGRDNGGGGLATGAALSPSAGAYFNDGQDGDFRTRTENIFDNPLGTILSSTGGSTFTIGYLDDLDLSVILRATEKVLSNRTLTAPIVTVYNTQRANLTVVNQLSYIQDFDVEVAQTSFIADPIVGIIQDGLTLDVRPTVSNDRRYITLELQPTVADLLEPIPTFATSLASSFAPIIIQLPELRIQSARTTVRVPDQGTILIGGLKTINTVDRQAITPILGDLPILGFLFSRKGRSDEVSQLMILVRAQITDLSEQETRMMSR